MIHARIVIVSGIALSLAAGCGKKGKHDYPNTAAGFDALMKDAVAAARDGDADRLKALTKDLSLPDAKGFYTKTFGPDHADALVAELGDEHGVHFGDDAPIGFKDLVDHGYTRVDGVCFDAVTEKATGFQNIALEAMKTPVALCTARFHKGDEPDHDFTLWSFVYVDGAYRMIGKTKALKPKSDDPMIDELGELPVGEAREMLAHPHK